MVSFNGCFVIKRFLFKRQMTKVLGSKITRVLKILMQLSNIAKWCHLHELLLSLTCCFDRNNEIFDHYGISECHPL